MLYNAVAPLPLVLLVIAVVACSDSHSKGPPNDGGSAGGFGPGISVGDALKSNLTGPLLVNGWLFVASAEEIKLCTALSESIPPVCGGPSLVVKGLDLTRIEGLKEQQGRQWSQDVVQLLGEVKKGVLTVSGNSKG